MGAPGIPFAITGVERARTVAFTGAEIRWDLTTVTSFKASYEGAFASGYDRHTLRGLVRANSRETPYSTLPIFFTAAIRRVLSAATNCEKAGAS